MLKKLNWIFVLFVLVISISGVSAHTININFYDENSLSAIPTVTITDANGSVYTSDVNGLWSIDLVGAKSFDISKTGYATRPFDFNFTADANYNFLLNPTGLDSSIGFIVKDSNNNLWSNKYLQFNSTINNNMLSYLPTYSGIARDRFGFKMKINAKLINLKFVGTGSATASLTIKRYSDNSIVCNYGSIQLNDASYDLNFTNCNLLKDIEYYVHHNNNNSFRRILESSSGVYSKNVYITKGTSDFLLCKTASDAVNQDITFEPIGNFIINSILTSSTGTATASLLANGDYNALLYDATGTLVDTYQKTTVTVNKPKNEITAVDISPYDISVGGLLGYSLTNQSAASISFNVFAGTQDFYYFSVVDYNAVVADRKYIPRQYFVQVPMGTGYYPAVTYQPYLLLETDAVVPKITVLDELNKPIGEVDVFISRFINNVLTIVESGKTTDVGTLSFSAYPLEYYFINILYNGVDKGTFRVQPRESADNFIIIIDTSTQTTVPNSLVVQADFSGTAKAVNIDDSNITANIRITQNLNQATTYNLYLMQGGSVKASTSGAITGLTTNVSATFASSVVDRFNNNLNLKLVVNYPDGNQTFYYTITHTQNTKGLFYFAPQVINDIGQPLGIILAILITGIILAGLTFSGFNIGATAISIMGVLILSVFMFLGWLDVGVTVLGFDIARFFFVLMACGIVYFLMRGEQYN